ncbi:MAG: DMT family transporter [Candidatus Thorarchaeota archaeon]|nr:MAG: DMT family transporter [Candidatus Thorarchaeota archaeon]
MTQKNLGSSTGSTRVILLLFLSVSMISSGSILIRLSNSPAIVVVFWRALYGSAVMALLGIANGDLGGFRSQTFRANRKWLVLIGIVLSLHFSTWFISLDLTTVAASVVLVNTSPIFTAIMSTVLIGEALRRRSWIGIIGAVTGALMLAWSDLVSQGIGALSGDFLAILGAVFLAMYFIGGRRYAKGIPITVYTSSIYLVAAVFTFFFSSTLAPFVPGIPAAPDFIVFEPYEVMIFLALAVFPTALGHSVNNYLLTIVPAYVVSSAVLGEPIGATLLAMVFLGEFPTALTMLGFVVIILGVGLVLADIALTERDEESALDDTNRS